MGKKKEAKPFKLSPKQKRKEAERAKARAMDLLDKTFNDLRERVSVLEVHVDDLREAIMEPLSQRDLGVAAAVAAEADLAVTNLNSGELPSP